MDGALELFRDGGIKAISLRKLAQHVGVSHTMMYRYFGSKEDLLTAIRVSSLSALQQNLLEADDPNEDVSQRIRAAAVALIDFGMRRPREYRFIFAEEQPQLDSKHALLKLRHTVFDHIVALADEARSQGLIAQDARTWVNIAWGLLHGMLILEENNQLLQGRQFGELLDPALEMLLPQAA